MYAGLIAAGWLGACVPPAEDVAPSDTGDTGDTVELAPPAGPWDEAGFWEEPGPLAELVLPEEVGAEWVVKVANSADGVTWEADPQPVAEGFNSLGLLQVNGGIVLTGLVEQGLVRLESPAAYALASLDGITWSSHVLPVFDNVHDNLVDPALYVGPDNDLRLVYYAADFGTGDPITIPGLHPIYAATWSGDGFDELPEPLYEETEIADPTVCPDGDGAWLFVTHAAERVHAAWSEDGLSFERVEAFDWEGWAVPSCVDTDEGPALVAQPMDGSDDPGVVGLGVEGLDLEVARLAAFPDEYCSSPAVARVEGGWRLFCAVSRLRPRADADAPP